MAIKWITRSVKWNVSKSIAGLLSILIFSDPAAAQESAENLANQSARVLAQLEGQLEITGLRQPVEVLRDRWGVPHIYAQNSDDLFFAQGFVAAQDRLFQLDLWRRIGLGETAELFGDEAIEADRFARLLMFRGDMESEWKSYSPDTREIATAFTSGINAYIDHVDNRPPIEFQILGYEPKHWKPTDILGRMSGIIMVSNWQREVARARLIASVGLDQARMMAPTNPPIDFAPAADLDLDSISPSILSGYNAATRALKFTTSNSESNNWVIDGTLSASGRPMLANDPHRALAIPSLRYMVHLHAPGWNVIGSGEPALPGVAIGHNETVAWGITIVGTDMADLYVEQTDPADPRKYRVGDAWEAMTCISDTIRVQGKELPVEVELRFTRHGPVVYQDDGKHLAFALRWVGSEPGGAAYLGSLAYARAKNAKQFREALSAAKVPGLNYVYASVEGDIGWVANARTPIRKNWDGLLPVPGAKGEFEWQGYLPIESLPQTTNPPEHFVATANHNILPRNYPHQIAYDWSSSHRFQRIEQSLKEKSSYSIEDFQRIQHDTKSLPAQSMIAVLRRVDLPDDLRPFGQMLMNWDGILNADSSAGLLYSIWLRELMQSVLGDRLPPEAKQDRGDIQDITVMLQQISNPTSAWFGTEPLMARDELIRSTLARAVRKSEALLGKDVGQWNWGRLHTATFVHPLASLSLTHAKLFNAGPVARPGDGYTANNTRYNEKFAQVHGASYRQIFDLADWDKGIATSAPGQSGQPGSPHYDDLLPLWAEGSYFPLTFTRAKVEKVTKNHLLLRPTASSHH